MKELKVFYIEGLTPEIRDLNVFYILRELKVFKQIVILQNTKI